MKRYTVINALLKGRQEAMYLEIGLATGDSWFRVRAPRKVGVDPRDVFTADKVTWYRKLLFELSRLAGAKFFALTSDEFFTRKAERLFAQSKIDVAFIDGWHSYEQSRKDVEACLRWLKADGEIVLLDCNPQSAAATAATPQEALKLSNYKSGWNGDVWKTIVYLRSMRPDLDIVVLDCDEGLGIIRFGRPRTMLSYTPAAILTLTYEDLAAKRNELLNLTAPDALPELARQPA